MAIDFLEALWDDLRAATWHLQAWARAPGQLAHLFFVLDDLEARGLDVLAPCKPEGLQGGHARRQAVQPCHVFNAVGIQKLCMQARVRNVCTCVHVRPMPPLSVMHDPARHASLRNTHPCAVHICLVLTAGAMHDEDDLGICANVLRTCAAHMCLDEHLSR